MLTKASDIMPVRQLLQRQGPNAEKEFCALLAPETLKTYQNTVATAWIPLEQALEIMEASAKMLFPQDPQQLYALGREVALIHFTGIYKIFLKIASPEFLVKRVSQLWHTFYESGKAWVENFEHQSGTLVVAEMPGFPKTRQMYTAGYIAGLLSLTGVKNIRVSLGESRQANTYIWNMDWK